MRLHRQFPRFDWRAGVILGMVLVAAGILACVPPIAQPAAFHRFADARAWLGVPNFADVASNAPFALAAVVGMLNLWRRVRRERAGVGGASLPLTTIDIVCLATLFSGVGLTSIGSAYYHLAPSNERLFWDRLPMILTFTSLLVTLIAERVSPKTAAWLLGPLLVAGTASLMYWRHTERLGQGDLRAYFLLEGAALVSVLLIVLLYPARYLATRRLGLGLACYALAVVLEQLDHAVWDAWGTLGVHIVSGHTLKHLAAGAGAMVLVGAISGPASPSCCEPPACPGR